MSEYDHPDCCGPGCKGVYCSDCLGTGHPHAPTTTDTSPSDGAREDGTR